MAATPKRPTTRSSRTSSPRMPRICARSAASSASAARSRLAALDRARRRAASSEASSRLLGLVEVTSRSARSMAASSKRPPAPRCSMADCVRLPACLCVLEMTRSAPAASACCGSASQKARCAPHASSTTSATPWAWRDAREARDVGRRAVVRGRDDDRRRGTGRRSERRVERGGQDAVREAELAVDLRGDEGGLQPGEDEPVDRAAVDGALDDHALAALGDGQARRQVALRSAVGEKPRPPGPPRVGR
jgi:hypothetical protein